MKKIILFFLIFFSINYGFSQLTLTQVIQRLNGTWCWEKDVAFIQDNTPTLAGYTETVKFFQTPSDSINQTISWLTYRNDTTLYSSGSSSFSPLSPYVILENFTGLTWLEDTNGLKLGFVNNDSTLWVYKSSFITDQTTHVLTKISCNHNILNSIINENKIDQIEVFPNPASSIIHINISKFKYFITDLNGQLIDDDYSISGEKIDISNFPDGIYILTIQTQDNIIHKKIIKKAH